MKYSKKLIALAATLFGVVGLAACNNDAPVDSSNSSVESSSQATTNQDEAKVNAALEKLSVPSNVSANFTLTTQGAGGVVISWTSSNTTAISITGQNATVKQSTEEVTVTLTATALSGKYADTKTFTVVVDALEDTSLTVAQVREQDAATTVNVRGKVMGFCYFNTKTDATVSRAGFYLADATGVIYVYGSNSAKAVEVGQYVNVSGTVDEYKSVKQVASPTVTVLEGDVEVSAVESTVEEVNSASLENSIGKVYKLIVKMNVVRNTTSGYTNYRLYSLDGSTYLNEYVSTYQNIDPATDAPAMKHYYDNDGQFVTVLFAINSANQDGNVRGNVLQVFPLDESAKLDVALASAVSKVETVVTATETVNLATTSDYESTVTYSLAETTVATLTGNSIAYTPTTTPTEIKLTVTVKIGEKTKSQEVTITVGMNLMTKEEFLALEDGGTVYVEGVVAAYNLGTNNRLLAFVQCDGFGVYLFMNDVTKLPAEMAVGNKIKVLGTLDIYNGLKEVTKISGSNVTLTLKKDEKTATITFYVDSKFYANGTAMLADLTVGTKVSSICGELYYYSGYQINPIGDDAIVMPKVEKVKAEIATVVDESYSKNATVTLPTTSTKVEGATIAWSLKETTYTSVKLAENTLTITPTETEETVVVVATITVGTETTTVEYTTKTNTAKVLTTLEADFTTNAGKVDAPWLSVNGGQYSSKYLKFSSYGNYITSPKFLAESSVKVDFVWYLNNTGTSGNKSSKLQFTAYDANGTAVATQTTDELNGTTIGANNMQTTTMTLTGTDIAYVTVSFVKDGGGNIAVKSMKVYKA